MAEGRDRQIWIQTSCLSAVIINASGNVKKGKTFKPSDFDPYYAADKRDEELKQVKSTWQMFEKAFNKNNRRKKKNAFRKNGDDGGSNAASSSNIDGAKADG